MKAGGTFLQTGRFAALAASVALVLALGAGCSHPARDMHARFYSCSLSKVSAAKIGPGRIRVSGCGHTDLYECPEGRKSCMRVPRELPEVVSASRAAPAEPMRGRVKTDDRGGHKRLHAKVRLNAKRDYLRLVGVPDQDTDHVHVEIGKRTWKPELDKCTLKLLINLTRRKLPDSTYKRLGNYDALRVKLPTRLLAELAFAHQTALRACDTTWTLEESHRLALARFVARFVEESAWNAPPRDSVELVEPEGGWKGWDPQPSEQPAQATGAALSPEQLYERLKPSVYRVSAGDHGGSAVAVSQTLLLTNCHVLSGAKSFSVAQGETRLPAVLQRGHPDTDRCVLRVEHPILKPVPGVRGRSDLKVGEAVYSLGAPEGFEATLGPGIISRLPEESTLVQTTAPVSPGSSGGGLFDAHGNLVGITTMIYVGEARVAQQLNFAITADAFWEK